MAKFELFIICASCKAGNHNSCSGTGRKLEKRLDNNVEICCTCEMCSMRKVA
jgi:hypothetical protein